MDIPLTQLASLLILNQLPLKDRHSLQELLQQGISPFEIQEKILKENLWDRAEKLQTILFRFDPKKEIDRCRELGICLLTLLDSDYPSFLRMIYNPPLVLYIKGSIVKEDAHALAVVGTRHPSFYGIEQARRFARDLAEKGLTIVSGLAIGVDHVAHQAAFEISHGRTIGVLGCGIDKIYPPGSEELSEKISKRGAVISEYPLGTPPLARHFPERNRIIAGLSHGVLVVEAHYRSGALITAHEAIDEGREVFAIPGPINQLTSRGTHRLLKEGAFLVENPSDVMEILATSIVFSISSEEIASPPEDGSASGGVAMPPRNDESTSTLLSLQGSEILRQAQDGEHSRTTTEAIPEEDKKLFELLKIRPITCAEWIACSGLGPGKALSQLTLLEMQKKVVKQSDGTYQIG